MRIVIGEDSVLLREGVARLLTEAGHDVVAAVGDADAALRSVEQYQPDLALLDIRMPPTYTDDGLRAALVIRQQWPEIAVLVLSQWVEERYATDLLAATTSAVGYLLKDRIADLDEFLEALQRVGAGGTALDPEVISQLMARRGHGSPLDEMTVREREVLSLMAEGRSNTAIAERLIVTEGAVEKHISNIFRRLNLPRSTGNHRRVLAVLHFLEDR